MPRPSEIREPNAGARLDEPATASTSYPVSSPADTKVPESDAQPCEMRQEFHFPGVLAKVPEYREQIMEFVGRHCPDEDAQIDILVSVQEALANAALHGCKDDAEKFIDCEVSATPMEIVISVRDPGPGFDLSHADPENYKVTTLTHGRGICLIRSLMTDVTFARNGAEIVMRKRTTRSGE